MREELDLQCYNSDDPCAHCPCNATDMPWKDLTLDAKWVKHVFTNETWHAFFDRKRWRKHSVFGIDPVTILLLFADILHVKHLGTDTKLAGAVLWLLCYGDILTGTTLVNTFNVN